MIGQDNEELRKQIRSLITVKGVLSDYFNQLEVMLIEDFIGNNEVDGIEVREKLEELIFKIRKGLFDAKVGTDKFKKDLDKHIAHCLNPIPKTAPKKTKTSARKKKDADTPVKQDVDLMIDFIEETRPLKVKTTGNGKDMNAIKKPTMTITRGNANKTNPAHDKPFE